MNGSPILLSYYTYDAAVLPFKKGTIGELSYAAYAAVSSLDEADTALIYCVTLPFQTKVHLLGIAKSLGTTQIQPTSGIMEKVKLEGDYDDYFSLYTEKGMQVEARYVLDPEAMEFTVDFCKSHNWELVRNELYFVQGNTAQAADDPTNMEQDIQGFVKEIQPAVAIPLTDEQLETLASYGDDLRRDYKCPLCAKTFQYKDSYYLCPDQHGILLSGRNLNFVRIGKLNLPPLQPKTRPSRPDTITCPASGDTMERMLYGNARTYIDSCPSCQYRWLDAGDTIPQLQP